MNRSFTLKAFYENNLVIKINIDNFFKMQPPVIFIIKDVESLKGFDSLEIIKEKPYEQFRKTYLKRVAESLVIINS